MVRVYLTNKCQATWSDAALEQTVGPFLGHEQY